MDTWGCVILFSPLVHNLKSSRLKKVQNCWWKVLNYMNIFNNKKVTTTTTECLVVSDSRPGIRDLLFTHTLLNCSCVFNKTLFYQYKDVYTHVYI